MGWVVSLVLPGKGLSCLVYPALKSVLRVPRDGGDPGARTTEFRLEREVIGSEPVDTYDCVKHRVTATDAPGGTRQAMTSKAARINDFPLKLQMSDRGHTRIFRVQNLGLVEQDSELFDLPAHYVQYDSREALMRAVMTRAPGATGSLTSH